MSKSLFRKHYKNGLYSQKLTVLLVLVNIFLLTTGIGGFASGTIPKRWFQEGKKKVEKRRGPLTEPIEIVEPTVKGNQITLGREFDAQPDWIGNLRFKVRNKYSKTITSLFLDLDFPQTTATGIMAMHRLYIGQRWDLKVTENNPPLTLLPNGEIEVPIEREFGSIKQLIEPKRGRVADINHIVVRVGEVLFEDGTLYANAEFWKPNPEQKSPHKWIPVGNPTSRNLPR